MATEQTLDMPRNVMASLRPVLLAAYRDLDRLRHDFPVVLLEAPGEDGFAVSLSTVVNRLALELAPRGVEGERLRRHLLRLEHEIRSAVAAGAQGEFQPTSACAASTCWPRPPSPCSSTASWRAATPNCRRS